MRENHPYFDTPLFTVGRESKFRKICRILVNGQYKHVKRDPISGKEIKSKYKQIQLVSLYNLRIIFSHEKPKSPLIFRRFFQTNFKENVPFYCSKLLGLVTYLDWMMIFVTTLSCICMMLETPQYRVMDHWELQVSP